MDFINLPQKLKEEIRNIETPAFIFDMGIVSERYNNLNNLFSANLKGRLKERWNDPEDASGIYYALKCNSLTRVVEELSSCNSGFEINNLQEYLQVSHTPRVINSSPITSAENVAAMHDKGVDHFCIDSKDHVDNLAHNAPGTNVYARIFFQKHGADLDLSKRLGIEKGKAPELLEYAKSKGLNPVGITFHVGSQCGYKEDWEVGISQTAELFEQFPEMSLLNVGGGLPVEYSKKPLDSVEEIVGHICGALDNYFNDKDITFQVEPGRYLVAPAGFTVTSVLSIDNERIPHRVQLDQSIFTGLVEKLEFGYDFQYPIQTEKNGKYATYTFIGPSCDGTDIIGENVSLRAKLTSNHVDPSKRDKIYLLNTGGYTLEYTPRGGNQFGFNKCPFPSIYEIKKDTLVGVDVNGQELEN